MKAFIAILFAMSLAACSSFGPGKPAVPATETTEAQPAQSGLQVKLTDDLNAAIARAKAATDPMAPLRVTCYTTLLSFVPELPSLPSTDIAHASGVFEGFEVAAELAENASIVSEFQIPPEVRVKLLDDCGPVKAASENLLLKFNLRIAKVAGRIAIIAK